MKMKISKFEKVAGVFVLVAIVGALSSTVMTAIHKGWFASKIKLSTVVQSADGIHNGTQVLISGLRAGKVEDIVLVGPEEIKIHFSVFEQFRKQIHSDSKVMVIRPFILGDKVLEISGGSVDSEIVKNNTLLLSEKSFDVMDLMSGKKLGPFIDNLQGLMGNIAILLEAFADPKRTQSFINMFDRVEPLLVDIAVMSKEVTKLSKEVNQILPQVRKEQPQIAKQTANLIMRLDKLITAVEPTFTELGPQLPGTSKRAVEALDEMVITLKAMQKSFFLRGNVEDVKEEEAKRENERLPASK